MFYLLRGIGDRDAGGGGATVALAASPLRYPQPFLTPKPLNLFVIHDPALIAGVVIGRPEPTTWMAAGILAQPSPRGGIGIPRSRRGGFESLGCAVLPGHPAGQPFTDPQHALKVTNGARRPSGP